MDIVLKLRELRRMPGLSQEEAAVSSGVGMKSLSSFETGERIQSMKLSQLLQLLATYNLTPSEFFGAAVERAVFRELERLSPEETELIASFRALPQSIRHQHYFEPEYDEFKPRTLWSLSNAFTSALKALEPVPRFQLASFLGDLPLLAAA
jgi:transcriptional regulator with XRE-family HTH domain